MSHKRNIIEVYVTPEMKEYIKLKAKEHGMSMSSYLLTKAGLNSELRKYNILQSQTRRLPIQID